MLCDERLWRNAAPAFMNERVEFLQRYLGQNHVRPAAAPPCSFCRRENVRTSRDEGGLTIYAELQPRAAALPFEPCEYLLANTKVGIAKMLLLDRFWHCQRELPHLGFCRHLAHNAEFPPRRLLQKPDWRLALVKPSRRDLGAVVDAKSYFETLVNESMSASARVWTRSEPEELNRDAAAYAAVLLA